jgi:predicted Fe-Mo cluster-binding NifX family protein
MASLRIAVGTADGISVCDHLARSASFLIFEIAEGRIVSRSVRERGTDQCGNHKTFTDLMEGCTAVICGGVGQGAVNSLLRSGVEVVVLAAPIPVDAAVEGYLAGTLVTTGERVCLCG